MPGLTLANPYLTNELSPPPQEVTAMNSGLNEDIKPVYDQLLPITNWAF